MEKRGRAIRATCVSLYVTKVTNVQQVEHMNPMRPKKSQAAMEFLMTYGWTILVIMIIIAVLYGMGIFDIKTPNTCFTPEPYKCLDVKGTGATFTALISASGIDQSSAENKVTEVNINGVGCAITQSDLKDAEDAAKTVSCTLGSALSKGSKFDGVMKLSYIKYGGSRAHSVSGSFSGTWE